MVVYEISAATRETVRGKLSNLPLPAASLGDKRHPTEGVHADRIHRTKQPIHSVSDCPSPSSLRVAHRGGLKDRTGFPIDRCSEDAHVQLHGLIGFLT